MAETQNLNKPRKGVGRHKREIDWINHQHLSFLQFVKKGYCWFNVLERLLSGLKLYCIKKYILII